MPKMTITEALQEIKTLQKRLDVKRAQIMPYVALDNRIKDPLHADGGSGEFIKRERQSVRDLEQRVVDIRTSIQRCNLETVLVVDNRSQSVTAWLNWRREISPGAHNFLKGLIGGIQKLRQDAKAKGMKVADEGSADITVNLNEKELLAETESMEKTLGDLDGKLSLLNATTVIDV